MPIGPLFLPHSYLYIGDFADPRDYARGEGAIALREKSCAEFSNKYFAYFKRSQRLAIGLDKMLIFFSFLFHTFKSDIQS